MKKKRLELALIGFGNIGYQYYNLIINQRKAILEDTGCDVVISHVVEPDGKRTVSLPGEIIRKDIHEIKKTDMAVVVSQGIDNSLEAIRYFLKMQCPVIFSAREAFVSNIEDIFAAASNSADIYFEAAVGGAIPIVEQLRRGFVYLNIDEIYGIIHGSTNFILSSMSDKLMSINELSKEVYEKGFSPTGSEEGVAGRGTADKMMILAGIAFNKWVKREEITLRGIESITISDIAYAEEFGYKIRHVGMAKRLDQGIMICAQPMLIPHESMLSQVKDENNIIVIRERNIGELILRGSGAGGTSAAISVFTDTIEVVRNLSQGIKRRYSYNYKSEKCVNSENQCCPFYVRLMSDNILEIEENLMKIFTRCNVKILGKIVNRDNDRGEAALITNALQEKKFLEILNDVKSIMRNKVYINYLPIFL